VDHAFATRDGMSVTVSHLRSMLNHDGEPSVCAAVGYLNTSSRTLPFSPFDWSMESLTANGILNPVGFLPDGDLGGNGVLGSGQLVAGGRTTATLCFTDHTDKPVAHGRYFLELRPDPGDFDSRVLWSAAL
jgi:hypothetical protein